MSNVLITGTSSGIGKAIADTLLKNNNTVYGISRTAAGLQGDYHEILMDLTDTNSLLNAVDKLCDTVSFDVLINNAGCGYYGLHENISVSSLHEMLITNVEVPMLLSHALLRGMKERKSGTIINISSFTAGQINPHGAAYGATKAALSSFSAGIFEEARKHNVRMIVIEPEMTMTNLYRNADFSASEEMGASLSAKDVAKSVLQALEGQAGYERITLQPQYRRIERKNQ